MATKVKEVTLTRKPFEAPGPLEGLEESLSQEVSELLGYTCLNETVQLRRLAKIFEDLGIEPFDEKKVEAYKKQEVRKVTITHYDSYGYRTRTVGRWVEILLSDYLREVPAFALLRATQVQKALNEQKMEGSFVVEELRVNTRRVVLDPFMVLCAYGQDFYLDVWNEPTFEGRRTK